MKQAVGMIAAAMEAADPQATNLFRLGAAAFGQEVASVAIDYQSTLSTCANTTVFTPDDAFAATAKDMSLTDVVVGTNAMGSSQVDDITAHVRRVAGKVFSETWVPDQSIREVAAAAHARVFSLDTLLGAPAGGWPDSRYADLLESNLAVLSSALGCESQ
jgi:ABC-type Zn uptake system ZnuABC Zn-binding protein ZnuA